MSYPFCDFIHSKSMSFTVRITCMWPVTIVCHELVGVFCTKNCDNRNSVDQRCNVYIIYMHVLSCDKQIKHILLHKEQKDQTQVMDLVIYK